MNKTTEARRHGENIFLSLCLCVSVVTFACGGTKMKTDTARKIIAQELRVPEERVEVASVSQTGGTVLAEGSLKITYVLQKGPQGKWSVVKLNYSNGWKTLDEFLKSVPEKSSLTRSLESAVLAELNREDR